jgi:hypothetical protein
MIMCNQATLIKKLEILFDKIMAVQCQLEFSLSQYCQTSNSAIILLAAKEFVYFTVNNILCFGSAKYISITLG